MRRGSGERLGVRERRAGGCARGLGSSLRGSPGWRLLRAGPEWGRLGDAVEGAGREQASEAVVGRSGVPESCLLAGQRRANRSPRLRLPAAAEKSQNFFSSSPNQLVPPPAPPPPPPRSGGGGGGGGGSSQTLGPRAAPPRLLPPLPAEAGPRAAPSRGVPRRGRPPCPRPGASLSGGSAAGGGGGTARGAKGGGGSSGGDRLGRRGVLKPPRPHPGSARGGGGPQGEDMGGPGHRPHLAWAGSEGGPLSPGGRGRAPRLRPANGVLPPGG